MLSVELACHVYNFNAYIHVYVSVHVRSILYLQHVYVSVHVCLLNFIPSAWGKHDPVDQK